MNGSSDGSGMVWAARLGELCGCAGLGPVAERSFLDAWIALAEADAGFLGLCPPSGQYRQLSSGFGEVRLDGICCGRFGGHASRQLAQAIPVLMLQRQEGGDWWPEPNGGAPLQRLLSVVVGENDQRWAVLMAGWGGDTGGCNGLVAATELLLDPLERALLRLAAPRTSRDRTSQPAWERSKVPLIFLREDGEVIDVNPAADRKLGVSGTERTLPAWLRETVAERIRLMRETERGLADVSGEHTYLGVTDGRRKFRVGIAPVVEEDGSDLRWLLTVEKGGPSLWERVEQAEDVLGLTPRESLVLELLARGMSNKQIGEVAAVKEATVKYHLFSVMRKSGTTNRTELLASFYAGDLSSAEEESDDDLGESWTDSVDLGFLTLDWDSSGLVRFVVAEGMELTLDRAQEAWEVLRARFDGPVKLFADVGEFRGVTLEALGFFGRRAGRFMRACAIRITSSGGRAAASQYLSENRPSCPLRVFRNAEEALAWLASLH